MNDTQGNPLVVGAMYCCAFDIPADTEEMEYGALVRYVGTRDNWRGETEHVFADADTWEETVADFDHLVKQDVPAIDPATKGYA